MADKFKSIREEIISEVSAKLSNLDYEVLVTGSQEICVPIVGDEMEEGFLKITFAVPKGSRDGDPYDGYEMAQDYALKLAEKKAKAEETKKAKAKKAAFDKMQREKLAENKARREAEKAG